MSGPFGSSQWGYASGEAGVVEGQSLRFNDDDNAYLSWKPAAAGDRKTWTWSGWVKRGNITRSALFVSATSYGFYFEFNSSHQLEIYDYSSGAYQWRLATSQVFRDPSAWYHIVLSVDTTQATSSDRVTLYVNGEEVTAFGTSSYPSLNWDTYINEAKVMYLGYYNASLFSDVYMAEVNFVDGTALDPTSFGETDANGQWVPIKEPSVTYGTNGFYLPFTNDYEVEGFNTVTYRGTGADQYIGGTGFEPDFVWIKARDTAAMGHILTDSVRGVGKSLISNATNAEDTNHQYGYLSAFNTDGFTVTKGSTNADRVNSSSYNYVAWAWDAGTGSAASNTDGSITSSVKANPDYGFSIVSFDFQSTGDQTIGHGLSTAPDMVIIKSRDGAHPWWTYHRSIGASNYLRLNATDQASLNTAVYGTDPTSSVFTIGSLMTTSNFGTSQIAYCFHSVAGYSDFGSYTGNGSSTGPTITTGFKPAFVMIKRTDYTAGWIMFDNTRTPYNPLDKYLRADTSSADVTSSSYEIDFNSNGFQIKSTGNDINNSSGTYIYMAFADKREAAFYLDQSGNNNDWTNNNMQESDISLDHPTNNFATLNPLQKRSDAYLFEGNTECQFSSTTAGHYANGTIGVSSGKYYWEILVGTYATAQTQMIGIKNVDTGDYDATWASSDVYTYYASNGNKYNNNSGASYGSTYATGDIIGVALDMDAGTLTFYKNNVSQGTAFTGLSGTFVPHLGTGLYSVWFQANFGQDSSFAGNKVAQGNVDENGFGDFYYEPPSGYLALCTQNLPDPDIADGSDYFNTVLYSGNGTANHSITGVGFQPDWLWLKNRTSASANKLFDVVRGGTLVLESNTNAAESSTSQFGTLDSDGFTIAGTATPYNASSNNYVAWNWKAGGTGVANTDGSISSTVSANQTAGFSIVTYAGGSGTVGHGLSQTPELIIEKKTDATSDWLVGTTVIDGSYDYVRLNTTAAKANAAVTAPASSVFTPNIGANNAIAYCFHSVEGYSKAGSYTGNGSTDGPFVYTGFKPALTLIKRTNGSGYSWILHDNKRVGYNPNDANLLPNSSGTERSYDIDYLSNGFKLRDTTTNLNGSGGTYIYMAFAENPFKYSNAR